VVKDGFLLIDGSPWENARLDALMKYVTLRSGTSSELRRRALPCERRGNTMENPLVGNLLHERLHHEIGAELYAAGRAVWMVMGGATGGEIRGTVENPAKRAPTFLAKLGYDHQVNAATRVRLTGSLYTTAKSASNTLYSGSRAGSPYSTSCSTRRQHHHVGVDRRCAAGLSSKVTAMVVNPFVKYRGLEVFATWSRPRDAPRETTERTWKQLAGEGLYRFCNERSTSSGAMTRSRAGWPPSRTT